MTWKSKREIERKVDELEPTLEDEYPVIDTLAVFLGYDWECVDDENDLYECDEKGQVHYFPPAFQERLIEVFTDDE